MEDNSGFNNVNWTFAKNTKVAIYKASRLAKVVTDDLTSKFTLVSRVYSVAQAIELRRPIPLDIKHALEEFYDWVASGRYKTGVSAVKFDMNIKDDTSFSLQMKILDAQASLLQGYAQVDHLLLKKEALALTGKLFETIDAGHISDGLRKKVNQIHTLMIKQIKLKKSQVQEVTHAP